MALGNTTSPGHHLGREKGGARRGRGGGEKERRKEGKDGEEEGEAEGKEKSKQSGKRGETDVCVIVCESSEEPCVQAPPKLFSYQPKAREELRLAFHYQVM